MERVSSDELRATLVRALETLAPIGSDREVPFNVYCDVMVGLLADFIAAAPEAHEIEELVALFRQRLEAALARRDEGAGHA